MPLNRIDVACPFCESEQSVPYDGSFRPRFHICGACWRRFIYEPTRHGVVTMNPREVKDCSNPDFRERDMGEDDY